MIELLTDIRHGVRRIADRRDANAIRDNILTNFKASKFFSFPQLWPEISNFWEPTQSIYSRSAISKNRI